MALKYKAITVGSRWVVKFGRENLDDDIIIITKTRGEDVEYEWETPDAHGNHIWGSRTRPEFYATFRYLEG